MRQAAGYSAQRIEVVSEMTFSKIFSGILSPLDQMRRAQIAGLPWLWLTLGAGSLACLAYSINSAKLSAAVILATAAASALSSIGGFAFSAICGAILFHLNRDAVEVVQIMITCSIANQAAMVWDLRHQVNWKNLAVFLTGGALGLPLGVSMLLYADRHLFTIGIGVFLIIYGSFMLMRPASICPYQHPAYDVITGFLGGITGGSIGFPGASVTIWCNFKEWNKNEQRALFQPFILILQVAALFSIAAARGFGGGPAFDFAALLCVPGSWLGTAFGLLLYKRLSDFHFAKAINILLVVSGLSLVL
ncbi:sulfite exporter TauE/SafE family protein [Methylobacterium sp. J-077]|uniref:sulfite exporter TauE/SafE family protein n=1 Tax=Methylobacterium sp. J-077 TaxID=2836656 RepID=UPI001FB8C5E4|nr:sulfite exporter TauE/SafE family protein [Methylobacterium sp. J-077]MCJ2127246.1 sulfite exporter TauE/SafE family protein [Methylobacterium sp. J-077]